MFKVFSSCFLYATMASRKAISQFCEECSTDDIDFTVFNVRFLNSVNCIGWNCVWLPGLHNSWVVFSLQLSMNDFSVHRIIGRGGFGEVYGCRKADTGKM